MTGQEWPTDEEKAELSGYWVSNDREIIARQVAAREKAAAAPDRGGRRPMSRALRELIRQRRSRKVRDLPAVGWQSATGAWWSGPIMPTGEPHDCLRAADHFRLLYCGCGYGAEVTRDRADTAVLADEGER